LRLCAFACAFCEALCAQPLTLYQAIQRALQHNETILYGVQQNYLTAQSQLHAAESSYRPQLELALNTYRSRTRIFSSDSYLSSMNKKIPAAAFLRYFN